MGPELMGNMRAQAERFGARFLTETGRRPSTSPSSPEAAWSPTAAMHVLARAVIIATGAKALMLGLDDERRLIGYGVSTCATCDGFFFRDRHIVVVGGGDSALEEANFLTKFGETVTVVHRRKELRASKIMQDRAFANPKIRFVWDSVVTDIVGDTKVEGVALRDTVTGESSTLPAAAVFVAIGHTPTTELFAGQLDLDDERLHPHRRGHGDQHPGRLRLRRRGRPHLPPGHHRGRHGLHGGDRRRALAGGHRRTPPDWNADRRRPVFTCIATS